jgi:hypothetical protein
MVQQVTTFDAYTALMHSAGLDPDHSPLVQPPSWTPKDARRRLHAYRILNSYKSNSSRFNRLRLPNVERRKMREYGDPSLVVDRIVGGILGKGATFTVEGSTQPPIDLPEIPARPHDVSGFEEGTVERRVAEVQNAVWEARAQEVVDAWADAHEVYPALAERQRWLDRWIQDEQVDAKLYEMEADGAVPLGDGVLVMGWSTEKQRPTLTVHEPDSYHPVLADANDDYPTKVHLAWEYEEDDQTFLRRITYELGPILPEPDEDGLRVVDPGEPLTKRYPWQAADEDESTMTCYLTDAVWNLNQSGMDWPSLDMKDAEYAVNEDGELLDYFDIGVDFLPVIHVPNTPNTADHFGVSSLTNTAQLFDDLATLDTNIMKAAALAGSPTIGAAGVNVATLEVRAGTVINLPPEGKLYPIDLSHALTALLGLLDQMLDRTSINTQVPAVVLGRVSGEDVPSGIALSLSFAPFEQLIAVLRLTRLVKYGLIPKFAQRFAQAFGVLDEGPTPAVNIEFMTTVPTDVKATVEQVVSLLTAKGIPRAMALAVLRDAGFPVESIEDAVSQIQAEDAEGGKLYAEALSSDQAAADYLGVTIPEATPETLPPPPPPPSTLPGPLGE